MLWYDIPEIPFHPHWMYIGFISFQFIMHHFQLKEHKIYMNAWNIEYPSPCIHTKMNTHINTNTHTHTHAHSTDVTIITTNKLTAAIAAVFSIINKLALSHSASACYFIRNLNWNWLEQIFGSFPFMKEQNSAAHHIASHQIYNTLHTILTLLGLTHSFTQLNFDFNWISNDTTTTNLTMVVMIMRE